MRRMRGFCLADRTKNILRTVKWNRPHPQGGWRLAAIAPNSIAVSAHVAGVYVSQINHQ
jgi:hypothetical protein